MEDRAELIAAIVDIDREKGGEGVKGRELVVKEEMGGRGGGGGGGEVNKYAKVARKMDRLTDIVPSNLHSLSIEELRAIAAGAGLLSQLNKHWSKSEVIEFFEKEIDREGEEEAEERARGRGKGRIMNGGGGKSSNSRNSVVVIDLIDEDEEGEGEGKGRGQKRKLLM